MRAKHPPMPERMPKDGPFCKNILGEWIFKDVCITLNDLTGTTRKDRWYAWTEIQDVINGRILRARTDKSRATAFRLQRQWHAWYHGEDWRFGEVTTADANDGRPWVVKLGLFTYLQGGAMITTHERQARHYKSEWAAKCALEYNRRVGGYRWAKARVYQPAKNQEVSR